MHDIYEDTCLHPGIIADSVAQKIDPENYEALSNTLEARAVELYRNDADFREKLAATRNDSQSTNQAAAAARDWLYATMAEWGQKAQENPAGA